MDCLPEPANGAPASYYKQIIDIAPVIWYNESCLSSQFEGEHFLFLDKYIHLAADMPPLPPMGVPHCELRQLQGNGGIFAFRACHDLFC